MLALVKAVLERDRETDYAGSENKRFLEIHAEVTSLLASSLSHGYQILSCESNLLFHQHRASQINIKIITEVANYICL